MNYLVLVVLIDMLIHRKLGKLAYARMGDEAWTTIESALGAFEDIAYFSAQFYALTSMEDVKICEISCPHLKRIDFALPPGKIQD